MLNAQNKNSFYNKVKSTISLKRAWKVVLENASKSESYETLNELKAFLPRVDNEIAKIYRSLLKKKFKFDPAKGVTQKKPGKKTFRPIVVSSIKNRIVQRSILDALHSCQKINELEQTTTSFGGIENRGVPKAIEAVYNAMNEGKFWFIRSDISNFFSNIPRDKVIDIIKKHIQEDQFIDLLENAIKVELHNMEQLGKKSELFPIQSIGVAQGCCLSPLLGKFTIVRF